MNILQQTKNIERLMVLFRGSENAHGCYTETTTRDPLKPKVKGKSFTVPSGPTFKLWKDHVEGRIGLGIIPINEEDKCYWGALDIDGNLGTKALHKWDMFNDNGTVDHLKLQQKIQELNLPLIVCYSKSKSAHCFLFLEEPVEAYVIRKLLEEMSGKLGVAGCEIFPKQDALNKDKGDLGNWLNMPYFGDTRKGVVLSGGELVEQDMDTFLNYAESKRLTPEKFDEMTGRMRDTIEELDDVLEGAPPCLQYILKKDGIIEGSRNIIMFNVGVYCKKKYDEGIYRDKVKEIHDKYVDDPLTIQELERILDSIAKKGYRYQCREPLLKQYCNSSICMDRECGIDLSTEIKSIKSAVRILTEPNIYAVEVELGAGLPAKVYVDTDQLFSQELFRKECSVQLHKTFTPLKPNQWGEICVRLVNTAVNQEPPMDMSEDALLYRHLQEYIANKMRVDVSALLSTDGVFYDTSKHYIYFKLDDFKSYLIRRGDVSKELTKWKLGKKLSNLEIPTDVVDLETGKTGKRKVDVYECNKKIQGRTVYVRYISDEEVPLSSIESLIETGDVV